MIMEPITLILWMKSISDFFMDKQLNLKDIQKEIDAIVRHFTVVYNTAGLHDEGQKLKNRLEWIRNTLRECLRAGHHNLDVLRADSAAGLHKTQKVTGDEVEKIKGLIGKVDSALNRYQNIKRKPGKPDTTLTNSFNDFEEDSVTMNKSEEKDPLQVTYQTIALLDAERYGTTAGSESEEKYPSPDLGQPSGQRTCGIADKIRMGSANLVPSGSDYRITIPEFCRNFHGGDI